MRSTTRPLTPGSLTDAPAIQALFEQDPAFWRQTEGIPPRPDEAARLWTDELPGGDKHVFFDGHVVLEMLEGYPEATIWFLGLIFVAPASRGQQRGTEALLALADHIRARGGTRLRLVVLHANHEARRLYERLGFAFLSSGSRTSLADEPVDYDILELLLR